MSTVYSNEMSALTTKPAAALDGTTRGGKVRIRVSKYEAVALASNSSIYMDKLPAGSRLLNGELVRDALGSGVTLAVGDGTTADKLLTATASNTANLHTALTVPISYIESGLDAAEDVVISTASAAATGTIMLVLQYVEATD